MVGLAPPDTAERRRSGVSFARPKSRTLACPRLVTKMLPGLISRWTMPSLCAASSASAISIARDSRVSDSSGRLPINEDLPPWIFEAWHLILSRELGLPHVPPRWLKQPAVMAVPITTPQVLERLGCFKDELRPFTVVSVPFPKKEVGQLWTGFFIMPYTEKFDNLHGRPMVNVVSGGTFYIHDKNSSTLSKPLGWLSLKTMEDEINHLLSRAEAKFCTPNGSTRTSKTIGLLVRRHIVAVEFHYIGKEASTRWASGPDLSMMAEAGALDAAHETFREYERVVDPKYLDQIRIEAKQFST